MSRRTPYMSLKLNSVIHIRGKRLSLAMDGTVHLRRGSRRETLDEIQHPFHPGRSPQANRINSPSPIIRLSIRRGNHSGSPLNGIDFARAPSVSGANIAFCLASDLFTAMGRVLSLGLPSVFFVIPARGARKSNFDWHAWDICGKQSRGRRAHTFVAAAADRRILKGFDVSELDARRSTNADGIDAPDKYAFIEPYIDVEMKPFTFHPATWIYWTFSEPINVTAGLAGYRKFYLSHILYTHTHIKAVRF